MKSSLVFLIVTLIVPLFCSKSKKVNSIMQYQLHSGSLTATCESSECQLTVNGELLGDKIPHYGGLSSFISHLGSAGEEDVFLINSYHGDGYPVAYILLQIVDDKRFYLSEFGNCNSLESMYFDSGKITFHFPELKEAQRTAATYIYHVKIHEMELLYKLQK